MNPRLIGLRPWLVRALIPPQHIGTYVLYTADGVPSYIGRSDTDLRRRLLRHCTNRRGAYFTYDVHHSPLNAFEVECALFHTLAPEITNRIHPDRPAHQKACCVYCRSTQRTVRSHRLAPQARQINPSTRTSEGLR